MKTLFILALLAFTAISASASTVNQELEWQQLPFQQQYPFPIYWQQPIPLQQQTPFQQQQQFLQQWQTPCPQQQQQFPQQPQFIQPFLQQQLNPCKEFLLQKCSPLAIVSFLRSQMLQQSSCQILRQQCYRQLAQIPEQFRYQAIKNIVHTINIQQQQQQGQVFFQPQQQFGQGLFFPSQLQQQLSQVTLFQPQLQQQQSPGFFHPQQQLGQGLFYPPQLQQQLGQGMFFPPQLQQQLAQGFFQPQQLAQVQALQTLLAACNVNVPQFGAGSIGIGGY